MFKKILIVVLLFASLSTKYIFADLFDDYNHASEPVCCCEEPVTSVML